MGDIVADAVNEVISGGGSVDETVESIPVETASESADPDAGSQPDGKKSDKEFNPIVLDSQEAADKFVKDRVARAQRSVEKKFQDQISDLQSKLQAFEDEKLSESEKISKRAESAEKLAEERGGEVTKLRRELFIRDKADELAAEGLALPRDLWDRVRGDTDEDIEADMRALAAALPKPAETETTEGRPPTRQPREKVFPTGQEPDTELDAESIVNSIPGFFNF